MRIHFKGAKLYDGTDKKPRITDVLVENGRVARVVPFLPVENAERVMDCAGLSLAPGFIDAHSHNDWFVARPDRLRFFAPFLEQGITTQVTGNCGFSPFGWEADSRYRSLIGSGLFDNEKAEGDVSTLSGFCKAAQGRLPLNIHPLVGHMSSRISLSGYQNRPLSEQEVARQDRLLERELDMGAGGISFGLMYEPDRYASYGSSSAPRCWPSDTEDLSPYTRGPAPPPVRPTGCPSAAGRTTCAPWMKCCASRGKRA